MQHFLTVHQIEERRARAGLSTPQLCAMAEVTEGTWSRWKAGRSSPLADKLRAVIEALESHERDMLRHLAALYPDLAAECASVGRRGEAA